MKNVFIIGSKGYKKNYGGWETFVKNLVDNYNDKETKFFVSEITHEKNISVSSSSSLVECNSIYVKKMGSATMLIYTIKAFFYYLNYIKKQKLDNCYIYVLGLKMGPFLWFKKRYLKKHNITVMVNPDGLEWKRDKWNFLIKFYFKLSERMMFCACDYIICDSKAIKKYVLDTYRKLKAKVIYISYGANAIDTSLVDKKEVFKKYNLKANNYYLIVGRFVPENNLEYIIKEYMRCKSLKKLVIVSNVEYNNFYKELLMKTEFDKDERIVILGAIYDKEVLTFLRENAFAYIHGHSVGGTNPSLLEALNSTNLNLLLNIAFNSEVGSDGALYFNKKDNSLRNLINKVDKYKKTEINKLGKRAKEIIKNNYSWSLVVDEYKKIIVDKK